MKAIEQLPHRHVRHEAHGNPMLHFVREHTYVLPDQEWGGAVSSAELVAAWRVAHPQDPRPTRSLQMHLAAAVKTVYTRQLKDGTITRSEHLTFTYLQGQLPHGAEARGWIGLRLQAIDQHHVRARL